MYDRDVWEATPYNTVVHRMNGRTKLLMLASFAAIAIMIDSPRTLFILFCITLLLHIIAKSSMARWRIISTFILLGIWGSMVSQALFYNQEPRTVVACLLSPNLTLIGPLTGGVFLYREGLEYGAVQALRSGIMLSVGLLLCWTSDPRQLLKSFLAWKMPYELAFMLITSLRFLPVIFQETEIVLTAQCLRGFEPLKTFSPRKLVRTGFQTLFPILARTLRRAATLAYSVESRGLGRGSHKLEMEVWPSGQRYMCYSVFFLLLSILLLKVMYALQFNGFIYISRWRDLYDVVKIWM